MEVEGFRTSSRFLTRTCVSAAVGKTVELGTLFVLPAGDTDATLEIPYLTEVLFTAVGNGQISVTARSSKTKRRFAHARSVE